MIDTSVIALIKDIPALESYFENATWRKHVKPGERDKSLGLRAEVSNHERVLGRRGETVGFVVHGVFGPPGELPVFTSIEFKGGAGAWTSGQDFVYESTCTCRVKQWCRHVAALHMELTGMCRGGEVDPQEELDAGLRSWLQIVKKSIHVPVAPNEAAKPSDKTMFYSIELMRAHGSSSWLYCLVPRLAKPHQEGWKVDRTYVDIETLKGIRHMVPEDLAIFLELHRRAQMHARGDLRMPLIGDGWEKILPAVFATGRLMYGHVLSLSGRDYDHYPLQVGPPETLELRWAVQPDQSFRPELGKSAPSIEILLTDPMMYLDQSRGLCGLVESRWRTEVVRAWNAGPPVPLAVANRLGKNLLKVSPRDPLPLPGDGKRRVIEGLPVTPRLRVSRMGVGPYLKPHLLAVPSFRYGDSPPLLPPVEDTPRRALSHMDGGIVEIERDLDAERKYLLQARDVGLLPLAGFYPAIDLNEKNRDALVLGRPDAGMPEWLELVSGEIWETLRAAGWELEVDSRLNLAVVDLTEIQPLLAPADEQAIDWFHFEVTAEYGGKRISLVPQIAQAIREDWLGKYSDPGQAPASFLLPCEDPKDGHIRFPAPRFLAILNAVRHLFVDYLPGQGKLRVDRMAAAGLADQLAMGGDELAASLAELGRKLRDIKGLPKVAAPRGLRAKLRPYQLDGYRWLRFLAEHGLHGVLADDMGLGKTLQTLAHLVAGREAADGVPSLVVAPTSVVPNWAAEAAKFAPKLKVLVWHGSDRGDRLAGLPAADLVLTSYALLVRDVDLLSKQPWHTMVLDEAQYIKNSRAAVARCACMLRASQRLCLSGTPMENHLGELWSLMRFLMPGYLADEKTFNSVLRRPIEKEGNEAAQVALNRRIAPLILRRTKDQVATELPEKTLIVHGINLSDRQADLYESVRAAMDSRVRKAISEKGMDRSHIIVLDALLKLRQICCHPQLLQMEEAQRIHESAKLEFLTQELLPTLLEEGRRILLFSQFTSMLDMIEEGLQLEGIRHLKLTGQTRERADLVERFQSGEYPVFLISLKAGGTGLNLTAADTVIHYDPWWNPAAENQATDRAHRIGQTKPVFVHKLVCRGTIEDRIVELQERKSTLVEALLSEETSKLRIDPETLSHLLAPLS